MSDYRQLPGPGEIFFDHTAHFVPDPEAAYADLDRLGFAMTPFTLHRHTTSPGAAPEPSGTGNRCVMFREGYLEIMVVTADTPHGLRTRRAMERYTGLHLLAFGTGDAPGHSERLAKAGFTPDPLVHLKRPVELADRSEDEARFICARVAPAEMPEGRIQFVQHLTESQVWQERWLDHANAAVGLSDPVVCLADPDAGAARYARFLGREAERRGPGHHRIRLDRAVVQIVGAEALKQWSPIAPPAFPFIAGYALRSADMGRTRDHLAKAGATAADAGAGALRLAMPASLGGTVWFQSRDGSLPWD